MTGSPRSWHIARTTRFKSIPVACQLALPQQLQPFAPAAPHVQNRHGLAADAGLRQLRQIDAQPFLDVFAAAAELVFQSDA
jgi:hypothetical protein